MSKRLVITLKQPNPQFEKWLIRWLSEAERRNSKSQHKLREALQALRSYPLPLASGRECAVLRGFGTTLCNLIDNEMCKLPKIQPQTTMDVYQHEVQVVLEKVQQSNRKKPTEKETKVSKKIQKAIADEEERHRQVSMSPDNFAIVLLVDTQETNGKQKRVLDQTRSYLESLAIAYEVRRLTVGDFLWIARDEQGNELVLPYIIERKRMDDLASSIRDGRFHEQKHRLRHCGIQHVIYLVEDYGDNEQLGLPLDSLEQAMANTQMQSGFNIVRTENNWRSMIYLQGMTKMLIKMFKTKVLISTAKEDLQEFRPNDSIVGLLKFRALYEDSARNALLTVGEVFVQQLLQLHSLSMDRALAITELYSTPRLLFDAYDACQTEQEASGLLSNICCGHLKRPVGEKISQTIYEFYNGKF